MKLHISFATAMALALPTAVQAEGPIDGEVYGRVSVSLDNVDRDDEVGTPAETDEWQLNSNASRFGYRGETAIDESLSVFYQVEWEVDVDDGATDLGPRNRFIGLKGEWGSVLAGRHDTPVKVIGKKLDIFNDLPGDIKNTFEGENRASNIVLYSSPSFGAFSAHVAFIPGEDTDAGDDGLNDGISAVAEVKLDNVYVALGIDRDVDGQDLERLVAQYTVGDFVFAAMAQNNEDELMSVDESGFGASVAYQQGANTFKVMLGQQDNDATLGTFEDEESLSLGYDRQLGDRTTFYAYITMDEDKAAGGEDETTTIGAGIQHKF